MERPVIGSSGYGRFLTSHYNPGSYISFLNSLSQKLGSKSEKKRIQKELKKREEERKAMQQIDDAEIKEDKEPDIECKLDEVEDNQKLVDTLLEQANLDNIETNAIQEPETKEIIPQPDQEMKIESEPQPTDSNTLVQGTEVKDIEIFKPPESKPKSNSKGDKSKASGEKSKESKKSSKNSSSKNTHTREIDNTLEQLKDDFDIEELAKTVVNDNHNKMVHDILNQNNSRISSGKKKNNDKSENAEGQK